MLMRNSRLNHIDTDWDNRNLFNKRRRWIRNLWLLVLVAAGAALYYDRDGIPDLLLDGFKVIAHAIPAQQPIPLAPPAPLN